ncbi:MAG: leucine-rich repeat domain-containing protein [Eubacteriales bacterium]|nr:leucine-rich repeat domain-containing protein [Eubacteriales bacterium]
MQRFAYKLIDDGTMCVTGYAGDEPDVVIPDCVGASSVTVLNDRLFRGHAEITSVHIPDTVTDLGEFLFDGCVNLRHITLPKQLTNLWGYTFVRSSFTEIVLPDKLAALPPFAFKDCKQLRKVVCGTGMKKIYAWAFGGCDRLEEVIHAPGVEASPEAFASKVLNT